MQIEYGAQSDHLIVVQGNDYVGETAFVFNGITPYLLSGAKLAVSKVGFCGESSELVYVTDSVSFVEAPAGDLQRFEFELNRADSSVLRAGVRAYVYEISALTLDGSVTRFSHGFLSVLESQV